ncbi:hypothetical protein [Streptomyces sp. VRA16 Mangrove soil]|uniref:hypothetical protein n=1 Tax=Streptomyces sp. VRA16 Mangrove soil TaxID=2817434 RepID=UPI001A9D1966|nr:hypothetical protein [Streptomyces sp. VRA16 Mangrove soil]MBO1332732.1 hypothetical protein [Streptomyces sp. VRA16 Mangrove soil]
MSGPIAVPPHGPLGDTLTARRERLVRARKGPGGRAFTLHPVHADDPVDALAAELADDVGSAVHPYEVAALLEAQGLSVGRIQRTYRHSDLFSLAEDVYRRVPRVHAAPPVPADPWRPDHVRCLLRGILFALPGTAYLLAGGLWGGAAGLRGLAVAALVSWAWTQGLSHRAYVRLAVGRREAARTLAVGAPLGAVAAAATGWVVAGQGPGAAFAVGQSSYLAAGGVLLVLGHERLLAAALLPVTAGALSLLWWQPPTVVRTGMLLTGLELSVAIAALVLVRALRGAPEPGPRTPLLHSAPYALFGFAAGAMTLSLGEAHPYAVVVLTLSMGPAEWLLYRFRGLAVSALRASATPAGFLLRAAGALLLCVGVYSTLLVLGALAASVPAAELLTVGAVLWTALLLQAFGTAWLPAAITLSAATTALVLPAALCDAAAAGLLLVLALVRLGSPTAHA